MKVNHIFCLGFCTIYLPSLLLCFTLLLVLIPITTLFSALAVTVPFLLFWWSLLNIWNTHLTLQSLTMLSLFTLVSNKSNFREHLNSALSVFQVLASHTSCFCSPQINHYSCCILHACLDLLTFTNLLTIFPSNFFLFGSMCLLLKYIL